MKRIKNFKLFTEGSEVDWHVMPDGSFKEVYCNAHDLVFNMLDWLNKLEETEPDYFPVIERFKKDLDRNLVDPHDIVESDVSFLSEKDVLEYLLDIILDYNNKKGRN